ncbi:MAG: hypothetical protein JWN70_500 [Planctomycetaceae bacterium]|nr:hypothetical protein [Planctomycetaceae bacterium]
MCFAAGCSGVDKGPELAEVTGKITLNDQPLANARVVFIPEDGPASGGITNESGEYELKGKSGDKGGVPGKNRVEISTDLDGTGDRAKEKALPKYNTASTLTANVELGSNNFDFKLESK